jgi:hypothetical protein
VTPGQQQSTDTQGQTINRLAWRLPSERERNGLGSTAALPTRTQGIGGGRPKPQPRPAASRCLRIGLRHDGSPTHRHLHAVQRRQGLMSPLPQPRLPGGRADATPGYPREPRNEWRRQLIVRRGHGASLPQLLNWLGVCDDSNRMGHITTASKQVTAKNRRGASKDQKGPEPEYPAESLHRSRG